MKLGLDTTQKEKIENGDSRAKGRLTNGLFVTPRGRGDGFRATIRGHILELADPSSGHALAPTPDDLFIASIASELAWSARTVLRAHGLPDHVSVSATWRTDGSLPSLADITLTARLSRRAEPVRAVLLAAFGNSVASRCRVMPVVHISLED